MATLNTVEKVGRVLDLFTTRRPDWGVTEVAEALGVPRSSAHSLLASLVDIGMLQWRPGGRYRLGWRVLELAEVHRRTLDVRGVAAPFLAELVGRYGETCHVAVLDKGDALYIDKAPGSHNVRVQGAPVGARLELHCTAVGKVLAAFGDPALVDDYLARTELTRHTPATITDRTDFVAELERVRREGVGYDRGEAVGDVFCVAAPIRDELGAVVAAVSLSSPVSRFERHRTAYVKAVQSTAAAISRALVDSILGDDTETEGIDFPAASGTPAAARARPVTTRRGRPGP